MSDTSADFSASTESFSHIKEYSSPLVLGLFYYGLWGIICMVSGLAIAQFLLGMPPPYGIPMLIGGIIGISSAAAFRPRRWKQLRFDPETYRLGLVYDPEKVTVIDFEQIRLVAATRGISCSGGPIIVFKHILLRTQDRTFRITLPFQHNEMLFQMLMHSVTEAVFIGYNGEVRVPAQPQHTSVHQWQDMLRGTIVKYFRDRSLTFMGLVIVLLLSAGAIATLAVLNDLNHPVSQRPWEATAKTGIYIFIMLILAVYCGVQSVWYFYRQIVTLRKLQDNETACADQTLNDPVVIVDSPPLLASPTAPTKSGKTWTIVAVATWWLPALGALTGTIATRKTRRTTGRWNFIALLAAIAGWVVTGVFVYIFVLALLNL